MEKGNPATRLRRKLSRTLRTRIKKVKVRGKLNPFSFFSLDTSTTLGARKLDEVVL